MEVIKCKMCGGELELTENASIAKCKYCGSMQTLPRERSDLRVNAYNRAGHFFMNGDFDKALSLYEKILLEDPEDANAYWSCILCKYGVNYVEDPTTHERKITVNRTQNTAVIADDTYKQAIKYATAEQRELFEKEAHEIDEIQKGILAISNAEEPFDVFISYKESDKRGERTIDSVLATDLYYGLTEAGYKVFLSRITLEDKLGREYEPYIYAALNSAKVMIVIGTRAEYFNAPWVKNEWSRYLKIIKGDRHKMLIPAYRDMDAYDLPEEFALLQAQDMSKIGFLQDIIRGVKKVISKKKEAKNAGVDDDMKAMLEKLVKEKESAPKEKAVESVAQNKSNDGSIAKVGALIRRAELFLEDGDFDSADEYADKALDMNPECGEAYLVKLLAELELKNKTDLSTYEKKPIVDNNNYQKILRFGDEKLKAEMNEYEEKNKRKIQIIDGVTYRLLDDCSGYYCDKIDDNVRKVTIPSNICGLPVTTICGSTFADCSTLTSITISEGVKSIGNYAFHNCSSLTSITLSNSIIEIGNGAISDCILLKDITIPSSVKSIGDNAFAGCSSLASVIFEPNSQLKSIEHHTFSGCKSLASVTFGDNSQLKNIERRIFQGCIALKSIVIPSSVTSMGECIFENCSNITSITIPYCPTHIGDIFEGYSNGYNLIPGSLREVKITGGASIGKEAFFGCSLITSVTIPSSVTNISQKAFFKCNSLNRVDITDMAAWCNISFCSIGANPLKYAHKLYLNGKLVTNLEIPNSVTSIGKWAFYGCSLLESVTVPSSVTSIGDNAFVGCISLASVTFEPNSQLNRIEHQAFSGCSSLASVTFGDNSQLKSIADRVFEHCTSLKSITIPSGVTSIGYDAFRGCSSITSITIPEGVTYIGSDAFRECSSLTNIIVPDSVTSIEENAFYDCDSLKSIRLPKKFRSIFSRGKLGIKLSVKVLK